jgi:hypothetical protein
VCSSDLTSKAMTNITINSGMPIPNTVSPLP